MENDLSNAVREKVLEASCSNIIREGIDVDTAEDISFNGDVFTFSRC